MGNPLKCFGNCTSGNHSAPQNRAQGQRHVVESVIESPQNRTQDQRNVVEDLIETPVTENRAQGQRHVVESVIESPQNRTQDQRNVLTDVIEIPVTEKRALPDDDRLTAAIENLSCVISQRFAKGPLESLKTNRDKMVMFVLIIAGFTTLSSLSSAPGGLDEHGFLRFKYTLLFWIYCVSTELTFLSSYVNLMQLYRPLPGNVAEDRRVLLRLMLVGKFIFLFSASMFLVSYVVGFWIVYPDYDIKISSGNSSIEHNFITYDPSSWPRWFTVGMASLKFICLVDFGIGRPLYTAVSRLAYFLIHWS